MKVTVSEIVHDQENPSIKASTDFKVNDLVLTPNG